MRPETQIRITQSWKPGKRAQRIRKPDAKVYEDQMELYKILTGASQN